MIIKLLFMEKTPEEITAELSIAKWKAIEFWKFNRTIRNSKLGEIRITEDGFNHIEYKDKKHKRQNEKEVMYRYRCFMYVKRILTNLGEYQEYEERSVNISIRRHWKNVHEMRPACYYWFVAIINDKIRVKVVVKKVDWFEKCEFVTVCPIWITKFYNDFKITEMFEHLEE